ncbi:MAG TPA: MCE family protein [Nocardioides sp.]|nr:MCE family protein [Nocardioides sp.]
MSDVLFPHTRLAPRLLRLRLAATGLVGCVALGLLAGYLGLQTLGVVSDDVRLTVELPTVGDSLGINSDVKYDGLRVGRVVSVDPGVGDGPARADGWDGPTAEVLVQPEHADLIPSTVRARVLPGTLFGNDFVDLAVPPPARGPSVVTAAAATGSAAGTAGGHLADGDVVPADTSSRTLRLMGTFAATQRLLAAVDPAQWDVALSQLADSLDGRGRSLAATFRTGDDLLARWQALRPQFREDLALLARDSDLFADVEPQLLSTIRNTRPLARTLVEKEDGTSALLTGMSRMLDGEDGATAFLDDNGRDLAQLLDATEANLRVFAERHPSFALLLARLPQLLENGAATVRGGRVQMEGVLGLQHLDPYDAGDCPTYRGLSGPCGGGR